MQIYEDGALIPLHPTTEAMVRAMLGVSTEILRQRQGMLMLSYSEDEVHLTNWQKNLMAEVRRKTDRPGRRRT